MFFGNFLRFYQFIQIVIENAFNVLEQKERRL